MSSKPVAWRWRVLSSGIASGWHYAAEEPVFAPRDLELIDGLEPLYSREAAKPNLLSHLNREDIILLNSITFISEDEKRRLLGINELLENKS